MMSAARRRCRPRRVVPSSAGCSRAPRRPAAFDSWHGDGACQQRASARRTTSRCCRMETARWWHASRSPTAKQSRSPPDRRVDAAHGAAARSAPATRPSTPPPPQCPRRRRSTASSWAPLSTTPSHAEQRFRKSELPLPVSTSVLSDAHRVRAAAMAAPPHTVEGRGAAMAPNAARRPPPPPLLAMAALRASVGEHGGGRPPVARPSRVVDSDRVAVWR